MKTLRLHVKAVYFDQIDSGEKGDEYRLVTPYWRKRLEGKQYDRIEVLNGYPKAGDTSRTRERPWRGYTIKTIEHPHFGAEPVEVFAIRVN
ncbi:RNA-binding protein (plasmid) [Burkholderia sp. KK1]|uniref:RNA-binding protein n=1 Tax=Burkholderia sp. M701 TaxID=326454 RepID=UPI0009799711|nr:RNA-binding protein [Burkholderia sp. M701]AQH05659.1 RNA-binding protein [Burkholderia sp. KK1]